MRKLKPQPWGCPGKKSTSCDRLGIATLITPASSGAIWFCPMRAIVSGFSTASPLFDLPCKHHLHERGVVRRQSAKPAATHEEFRIPRHLMIRYRNNRSVWMLLVV